MKSEELKAVISAMLDHEARPAGAEGLDVLLVIRLLILGADEKPVKASDVTLSMALAVSEVTARASVERARGFNWIQKVSGKSRRQGNLYSVLVDNLPVSAKLKRTVVTEVARQIAGEYVTTARFNAKGKKRRYTEADRQRIAFLFQQWLAKHCDDDVTLLRGALRYAMAHPLYKANALYRLHRLRKDFSKIVKEFKANGQPTSQAAEPAKPATPVKSQHELEAAAIVELKKSTVTVPVKTFFSLQGKTARSVEEFKRLLSDPSAFNERTGCVLMIGTVSHKVDVVRIGGMWLVLDCQTGKGVQLAAA